MNVKWVLSAQNLHVKFLIVLFMSPNLEVAKISFSNGMDKLVYPGKGRLFSAEKK